MAALARGDAEQLLRFIAEAESIGGDQLFTPELLAELGRLIPADSVVYNELDRVGRRRLLRSIGPTTKTTISSLTTRRAGGRRWRSIRCAYANGRDTSTRLSSPTS